MLGCSRHNEAGGVGGAHEGHNEAGGVGGAHEGHNEAGGVGGAHEGHNVDKPEVAQCRQQYCHHRYASPYHCPASHACLGSAKP